MVKVKNLLLEYEVPLIFCVMPIIFSHLAYQESTPHKIWWKEPIQFTNWDLIERVVWHNNLENEGHKIYILAYCMIDGTFMYLVKELEFFVKFRATMFVRAPLEPRKAIGLVLYQFAHGVSANIIANRFNVGAFIVHKYVDIVVDVLISRDKLFSRYIFIHYGPRLLRIMDRFFHACRLPNVSGTIDGSHIALSQKQDKWVTVAPTYYD
jgi:hypothetical protein